MMRVLITGGSGLLGVALQRSMPENIQGFSVYFPVCHLSAPLPCPIRAANVSSQTEMQSVFEWAQPDVVIHAAAIGSVDFAEKNREQTRETNVGGTRVIIDLCKTYKCQRLIYLSSNAVFDGISPLYSETDPVSPLNYYGKLKVEAEMLVRSSGVPWAIVRPILMYGWPYTGERDNTVTWLIRSLENNKYINIVDNVFTKPLAAWSCAEVIWSIIQQNRTGMYHAAGRDHLSLYEFALLTAEVFGLDARLIKPVPDSYFPEIAPRPRDTSFDTSKMENELGVKPIGVKDGLVKMKAERVGMKMAYPEHHAVN